MRCIYRGYRKLVGGEQTDGGSERVCFVCDGRENAIKLT